MGSAQEKGARKGIKELCDNGLASVPQEFIRPPHQRPSRTKREEEEEGEEWELPIIDIAGLSAQHGSPLRERVLRQIGMACRQWGFFQVVNHGFPSAVIESMWEAVESFFKLSAEERMRFYSEDFNSEVAYTISFNPSKERILEWKDALYFRFVPGQYQNLKDSPEFCRLAVLDYLKEQRILGSKVFEAIFESLGVLKEDLPELPRATISANYYPPCPDPSLTLGLSAHSDMSTIAILTQNEVNGLEVFKNGRWITVKAVPGAFVVNLGDQIEILSNGEYQSVLHRAVTNSEQTRISLTCFFDPDMDAKIGPLPQLIDETHPRLYKENKFGDYMKNFYTAPLSSKWAINFSKCDGLKSELHC